MGWATPRPDIQRYSVHLVLTKLADLGTYESLIDIDQMYALLLGLVLQFCNQDVPRCAADVLGEPAYRKRQPRAPSGRRGSSVGASFRSRTRSNKVKNSPAQMVRPTPSRATVAYPKRLCRPYISIEDAWRRVSLLVKFSAARSLPGRSAISTAVVSLMK